MSNLGLEGTAPYGGFFLAPAEGFGLRPRAFLRFRQKPKAFYAIFAYFWCLVATLETLSNNHSAIKKIQNPKKKIQKSCYVEKRFSKKIL